MAWNEPGGEKRDPWNRPHQQQNDLDDILRNIQRRLSALFGRSGSGGGGSGGSNFGAGLVGFLVLIGVVWIGSGVYRVDAQERAVILRFGKHVDTTGPGYNWHLPWPIERSIIVNVSQVFSITEDSSMLTADTNLVEVHYAVQYTQPDALKFLYQVRGVEETLNQVFESAMREAVGQASLDKALAFDPSITVRARDLMQRTLVNYGVGVNIVAVKLNEVGVPEAVQEAQRDAIKADKDRQRYQQEAEIYRNDVVPRARGAAAKELQDAQAYKLQVIALAQGETSRFDQVLAQYEHAPGVTRERMYLETMENVYKNSRKVFIDTKAGGNNMIYLPLDKLMSQSPQSVTLPNDTMTVAPAKNPEIQVSPTEDPARARGVR
jgi:membrane protease subunit HflK